MVFKQGWERASKPFKLLPQALEGILTHAFEGAPITFLLPLGSVGLRNLHYRVVLEDGTQHVLRVYLDDACAQKEWALAARIPAHLPVTRFTKTGNACGHAYGVGPLFQGEVLSYVIMEEPPDHWRGAVFACAQLLVAFGNLIFEAPGFLDGDLVPHQPQGFGRPQEAATQTLASPHVAALLGTDLVDRLAAFLQETPLPEYPHARLVHGDFNPANVLVKEGEKGWEISALLDWEFAFAGSPMWDIANWLREAKHVDPTYTQAFLSGLEAAGFTLDAKWQHEVRARNIIMCLDLLARQEAPPKEVMAGDLKKLLEDAVSL